MTEHVNKPLSVDLQSFSISAPVTEAPVSILNEESSIFGRLHYCAGIVSHLCCIAELGGNHENDDVGLLAQVFSNQLHPLLMMLNRLISDAEGLRVENGK